MHSLTHTHAHKRCVRRWRFIFLPLFARKSSRTRRTCTLETANSHEPPFKLNDYLLIDRPIDRSRCYPRSTVRRRLENTREELRFGENESRRESIKIPTLPSPDLPQSGFRPIVVFVSHARYGIGLRNCRERALLGNIGALPENLVIH